VNEAELKTEAEEVEVKEEKGKPEIAKKIIPVERISAIYAYGRISFTSGVISYLSKYGTAVHFYNYYGFYEGSYYPREKLLSGDLVIKQAEHYIDNKKRLKIAKAFVQGAAENIMRNLEYYNREGKEVTKELEGIRDLSSGIERKETNNVQRLMAIEGAIRNTYYQSYDKIVPSGFKFGVRTKQPPENPLNALISFGNSLLYGTVLTEIYNTQLNPTISYLHEPSERRFSLSLDIAEVFKPFLVDRVIFKLVNKHVLSDGDFVQELNSCLLNDKGRRTFIAEWDDKLKTTIKHRDLKRNVSYQRLIRLECYKLTKHLLGTKRYKPFVIWW
jgi:CRISPR-associated protein Cas1